MFLKSNIFSKVVLNPSRSILAIRFLIYHTYTQSQTRIDLFLVMRFLLVIFIFCNKYSWFIINIYIIIHPLLFPLIFRQTYEPQLSYPIYHIYISYYGHLHLSLLLNFPKYHNDNMS